MVCLHGFTDTRRTWELAARGRAQTVVAFAPAGGWAQGDESYPRGLLSPQSAMHALAKTAAPHAESILASPEGRRSATQLIATNFEHIPAELLAHQIRGAAGCVAVSALIDHALGHGWSIDAEKITCPCGSSGAPATASCRGPRPPLATATTGCPTPTGSSWRASATALSSTLLWRPQS